MLPGHIVLDDFFPEAEALRAGVDVSLRLTVGEDGRVAKREILYDRLLPTRVAADPAAAVAEFVGAVAFPGADGPSLVTIPVRFGPGPA